VISLGLVLASSPVQAENSPLSRLIDRQISTGLEEAGISPAEPIDDDAFLRRVMLDLAGRIPTAQELAEFRSLDDPDKRTALVDRLLESPDFAFHLRNELDILLLARKTWNNEWREYLLEASRENRSWDVLFREIMLPEYERPDETGPAAFIRERVRDLDDLTNDASSLLFGVNIGCAKCHDHPLVDDWEQRHYFGMAMFFKRTYRTKQGLLAERPDGNMKFTDILGEDHQAEFMFLTGARVDEPELELSEEELKKISEMVRKAEREDDAELPPLPEFSPRRQFVELALSAQADIETDDETVSTTAAPRTNFLASNIVNRTWARLMGRGLVHPLDQMHSDNRASHPDVLDALTADFIEHGYDLKRLTRQIVLSDAYARSSRWTGEGDVPPPELYGVAVPRPLTPWQVSLSLIVASRNPEQWPGLEKPEEWEKQREQIESHSHGLARRLEIPDDGFQVGAEEALFFTNAEQVENEYLRDAGDRLIGALKEIEETEQAVRSAFRSTLSRDPTDEELEAMAAYIASREERSTDALRQVVWALLTSPEFRFNH
jgi:hypothetical protein